MKFGFCRRSSHFWYPDNGVSFISTWDERTVPEHAYLLIMLIKDIQNGEYFRAIDNTILCELLHPAKEDEVLNIPYSIAHAIVKPGETTLPHKLKTSTEVYYVLDGEGIIHIDEESAEVHSGQAIYIPPNTKQYIQNRGNSDLKILCIVYPMWRIEDEKVL